jgi:8-oxo-dGTP pyrophosphatase MutT (NUDIX family)
MTLGEPARDASAPVRGTVAAVYLLRDDGAALLQLRDDKPEIPHADTWVPPGGHCRDGEEVEACARREFAEETEVQLGRVGLVTRFVDDNAKGFDPLDLSVYWAVWDGAQAPVCHEGRALEFVRREDAERYGVPAYLLALWDDALRAARGAGALPAAAERADGNAAV